MNLNKKPIYEVFRNAPDPEIARKPYGFYAKIVDLMKALGDGVIVPTQTEAQAISVLLRRKGFRPQQFTLGEDRILIKIVGLKKKK